MFNPNPYPQFQNPYGMYGMPMQPAPMVKPVQPLTQDEINHLRTQVNELTNVALTPDEIMKAKCTHKFKDGRYSLIPLDPHNMESGDVVCEICGAQFNLNTIDESTLASAIAITKNAMQQVKALWPDIPMAVATEYMMSEPLLSKLPGLYKVANDHNAKYNNSFNMNPQQMGYTNGGYGTGNGIDIFNGIANGMYMYPQAPMGYPQQQPMQYGAPMGQPMYQQQAPMGYPQQQPMQYGAPMGQPMYQQQAPMGYPQQQPMQSAPVQMGGIGMGGNPFGYETTAVAQQPVQAVQQPQAPAAPMQPAPAAAPANAPAAPVEVKKQFSL